LGEFESRGMVQPLNLEAEDEEHQATEDASKLSRGISRRLGAEVERCCDDLPTLRSSDGRMLGRFAFLIAAGPRVSPCPRGRYSVRSGIPTVWRLHVNWKADRAATRRLRTGTCAGELVPLVC
jgi:hypothetical protein